MPGKKDDEPSYRVLRGDLSRALIYDSPPRGHNVLRVTLSGGATLDVELWERSPGRLAVRALTGSLAVHGHSANLFELSVEP